MKISNISKQSDDQTRDNGDSDIVHRDDGDNFLSGSFYALLYNYFYSGSRYQNTFTIQQCYHDHEPSLHRFSLFVFAV